MDKSNATKLLDPRNLSDSFGDHREVSFWQVPQLVMLTSLFLLIVVGNGCVLLSLIYSENGIKTRMNFFILHLAIADLLVGLVIVGHDIVEKVQIDFNGGSFLCKLLQYIKIQWTCVAVWVIPLLTNRLEPRPRPWTFGTFVKQQYDVVVIYSSTYVLVSMSIDRLDAVARPMRFSRREFRAKVLIAAAWILSFVFALPILVLFDVTDDNVTYLDKTVTLCDPDFNHIHGPKIYMTLIALAAFIIPTLIIMVCYCFIIAVICRNDDDAQRERSNWTFERQESLLSNVTVDSSRGCSLGRHRNPIIERAKVRTVKMTVFIVLAFIICWCPYFGFMLYQVYVSGTPHTSTMRAVTSLVSSLSPLNSAVNPIIYGIFSTRICRNLRRVPFLKHFVCCGRHKRRFGSRMSHTSQVEGVFLNDVSSLRRRQMSGSRWNSDPDQRNSRRTNRPLLHKCSSLSIEQPKQEVPSNNHSQTCRLTCKTRNVKVSLNRTDEKNRSIPLLHRELSVEDGEILRSYTVVKQMSDEV